jgi:hypothetical protein
LLKLQGFDNYRSQLSVKNYLHKELDSVEKFSDIDDNSKNYLQEYYDEHNEKFKTLVEKELKYRELEW